MIIFESRSRSINKWFERSPNGVTENQALRRIILGAFLFLQEIIVQGT
jgi:hypothetical protein